MKYDWTVSCTNAVDVLGVDFPCQNISMPYELGVGVYHVIPAIGNKLFKAERGGPQGKPVRLSGGCVLGSVTLR